MIYSKTSDNDVFFIKLLFIFFKKYCIIFPKVCHNITEIIILMLKNQEVFKMHKFKKFLAISLMSILALSTLTSCNKKPAEQTPVYELKALTEAELEPGNYYMKSGDAFYVLPSGQTTFEEDEKIADPLKPISTYDVNDPEFYDKYTEDDTPRVIMFGPDDVMIPTMYKDDELVYMGSSVPEQFVFERYCDYGYSLGVAGMKKNSTNAYEVPIVSKYFQTESSLKKAIKDNQINNAESESETIITIPIVGNIQVGAANISPVGSITGLEKNKEYDTSIYRGTRSFNVNVSADTHIFGAMEVYASSIVDYTKSNYIRIPIPENFVSGYYYVNGIGFVKYIDNARAQGISNVDMNAPYYFYDEEGNLRTNEGEEQQTQEELESENYYSIVTNIDCANDSVDFILTYDDAKSKDASGNEFAISDEEAGLPKLKVINPDGKDDYVFNPAEDMEKTLKLTVEDPVPGEWEIRVYNSAKRNFKVTTSFTSGHSNVLYHTDSDEPKPITYFVPTNMKNAQFIITWDNQVANPSEVYIKDNFVNDPSKKKEITYTRDSITNINTNNYTEARGEIRMTIGEIKYGDYTVWLDSKYGLGRVRVEVVDLGDAEPEAVEPEETETETENETEAEATE